MRSLLTPLALPLLLAACADDRGDFPSLLPRPIESRSEAEPVRPVPVAAPDPTLDTRIGELQTAAGEADRSFTSLAERAERLARSVRGTAAGSDRWLDAQVALAELDVARTAIQGPAAELQQLQIDRATSGQPAYPALDAAVSAANALAETQVARVRRIEALLS